MRFLRSSVAYRQIAEDMLEVCPNALLINYANPMAMNCWFLSSLGIKTVGLCHSVQNTTQMLAKHLEIPYSEISYKSAGINHQAWLLEFKRGNEDLYPRIREVMRREHLERTDLREMAVDHGDHSDQQREWTVYEGGQEQVRTALMDTFGFFHTESSHHASEYVAWFRKNPESVLKFIPERWDYFQICSGHSEDGLEELLEGLKVKLEPSLEYGSWIINAMETDVPAVIYGNVPNSNLISNLPEGCCVEVACLVDRNGVQPTHVGKLPPQLAALNRTNINVQELAVEAALTANVEHVYHAMALDPLTSALLTLEQVKAMTNELLEAHVEWMGRFKRKSVLELTVND
jgi:alpha-galactosidase